MRYSSWINRFRLVALCHHFKWQPLWTPITPLSCAVATQCEVSDSLRSKCLLSARMNSYRLLVWPLEPYESGALTFTRLVIYWCSYEVPMEVWPPLDGGWRNSPARWRSKMCCSLITHPPLTDCSGKEGVSRLIRFISNCMNYSYYHNQGKAWPSLPVNYR